MVLLRLLLLYFFLFAYNYEALSANKVQVKENRSGSDKVVTLFVEKDDLFSLSKDRINKFIKEFDYRNEDEISLLWLQFPFTILTFLINSLVLLGALFSFIKSAREAERDNYLQEKALFREQWKKIRGFDDKILSLGLKDLQTTGRYRKKEVVVEVDMLLDHLDDIYTHYKSWISPGWRAWERDFERVFSKKLIQSCFLKSKEYSFSEGFRDYGLALIKKFTDQIHLDSEYTETIEEAESEVLDEIHEIEKEQESGK